MAAATAGRANTRRKEAPRAKKRADENPAGPVQWDRRRESDSIRWNRVLSAQARIATDYYERDDVKDLLVDAVLDELTSN